MKKAIIAICLVLMMGSLAGCGDTTIREGGTIASVGVPNGSTQSAFYQHIINTCIYEVDNDKGVIIVDWASHNWEYEDDVSRLAYANAHYVEMMGSSTIPRAMNEYYMMRIEEYNLTLAELLNNCQQSYAIDNLDIFKYIVLE